MIPYETDSPNPVPSPCSLVVKKGSKILRSVSLDMSSPLSETSALIFPSVNEVRTVSFAGRSRLAAIRSNGLSNERFIDLMLERTAMFSATVSMVGMEKALSIHREIMDQVAVPMNEALLPSGADLEGLDDPFGAFRKYLLTFFEAENTAGLHEYRIVEDNDKALAVDVTYCAFCEIPKRLGVIEACEAGCYSDEVLFPDFLEPFGLRFVRTQRG